MREEAKEMVELGLRVGIVDLEKKYPVGVDGWQKKQLSIDRWRKYDTEGVCVFTGEVEIIDVDVKHWKEEGDFFTMFQEQVKHVLPFSDKLVWYKTQSGGLHYPYRCEVVEGNQKLARRLDNPEAIIETRGKNGLAVCPPSVGYEWIEGNWEDLPTLTPDERTEFVELCRDWNQEVEIEVPESVREYKENTGRPGDDWASKNDFIEFIKDHGWAVDGVVNGCVMLRRPGKDSGCSASWNYKGLGRMYVWSTSTELPTEKLLKPFAVKAYLEHDGDFKACAVALRDQGYGNDALAMVEACEGAKNWGEVALIMQENEAKVKGADWSTLCYGIQALGIKGVTELKLEKFKKSLSTEVVKWQDNLTFDEDEKVKNRIYNADLILNNDERYKGLFFWDDFAQKVAIINRKNGDVFDFDDTYEARLQVRLGREYGDFRIESLRSVVLTIAKDNHFHPLQEKIKSFEWDGVSRVDTWLSRYCGAEDSEYLRIVSRKWLISAIARLFRPGCKVDSVLVLEGDQGTKKSSLLRMLCYDNFLDGGLDIRTKDGLMALFGKWIVEFSELEGMNGRTSEQVKAFLTKQDDKIRPPYGKSEEYFKRTCVFVGTTNKDHYLHDASGNRRFWPVKAGMVQLSRLEEIRDQLWAEAYQLFRNGEKWWIDEESDEAKHFRNEQNERVDHSDIEERILEYLMGEVHDDGRVLVKLHNVWADCLGGKMSQIDRRKEREIADCLRRIGLKKGRTSLKGVTFRGWYGTLKGGV